MFWWGFNYNIMWNNKVLQNTKFECGRRDWAIFHVISPFWLNGNVLTFTYGLIMYAVIKKAITCLCLAAHMVSNSISVWFPLPQTSGASVWSCSCWYVASHPSRRLTTVRPSPWSWTVNTLYQPMSPAPAKSEWYIHNVHKQDPWTALSTLSLIPFEINLIERDIFQHTSTIACYNIELGQLF